MTKKSLLAIGFIILFGRHADGLVLANYAGSHVLACSVGTSTNGSPLLKILTRYFNPLTYTPVMDLNYIYQPPLIQGLGLVEIHYERPFEARLVTRERTAGEEQIRQTISMIDEARKLADGDQPDGAHRFGDATVLRTYTGNRVTRERFYQLDCHMMDVTAAERVSAEDLRRARALGIFFGAVGNEAGRRPRN